MTRKTCLLTGVEFKTNNPNDLFSPMAQKAFIQLFKSNEEIRKEVVSEILQDDDLTEQIAVAVMSTPATSVGLNTAGTISEFFLGIGNTDPTATT